MMHLLIWNGDAMTDTLETRLIIVSELNKNAHQQLMNTCTRLQQQLSNLSKEHTTKEDKNEKNN
jgi:hypothetical protein